MKWIYRSLKSVVMAGLIIGLATTTHAAPIEIVNAGFENTVGQALGIRLVNLNQIPVGFTADTSPDLEVDFDDVALTASTPVPIPSTMLLLVSTLIVLAGAGRNLKI